MAHTAGVHGTYSRCTRQSVSVHGTYNAHPPPDLLRFFLAICSAAWAEPFPLGLCGESNARKVEPFNGTLQTKHSVEDTQDECQ